MTNIAAFPTATGCSACFASESSPHSFSVVSPVIMDIQRTRFPFELVKIMHMIADSHFVAFDLEFSGIPTRRNWPNGKKPSLQEYYEETKEAAHKYQVLQVGLTVVHEDLKKGKKI